MIDLDQEQIERIKHILGKFVPDYDAVAFGSRVGGAAHRYSDLDLVLIGREQINPMIMTDLKEAFSESDLPISVDLLDWQALSDSFRRVIAQSPRFTMRKSSEENLQDYSPVEAVTNAIRPV